MKRIFALLALCCFTSVLSVHLWAEEPLVQSRYALELFEQFNTPDGTALDSEGNMILAVPNAHAREGGTWLLKITPDEKVEKYFWLPPHPETNKACPLGIVFGSDGHLYICDAQGIGGDTTHKSRILRVIHKNGQPVRCETLVTNLVQANGIAFSNGKIYFAETQFPEKIESSPIESGVFCFDLKEFRSGTPIRALPDGKDRHCIYKFKTENVDWPIGANGIGVSNGGSKVYVANFGDKQIIELTLDASRSKVLKDRVCIEGGLIESVDGLKVCPKGYILFADFVGNAVFIANPENGKTILLAKDPAGGTGKDGELDRCSEVCLRGSKLYVSNIDLPYGNKNDEPYSLSVLDLNGFDFDELLK
ncbi:MAG: SMP-30/gluconolactonase/LRE family protein [Thermoguttaceae bacterium]